jgi:hypothetical protein
MFKKNLKIPKGGSEAVKQIKQWPNEKRKHSQTMIYKALLWLDERPVKRRINNNSKEIAKLY